MEIRVELGGFYREKLGRFRVLEMKDGSRIEDVLNKLGISASADIIIIKNGKHAKLSDPVANGDQIAIFPPVGGGEINLLSPLLS